MATAPVETPERKAPDLPHPGLSPAKRAIALGVIGAVLSGVAGGVYWFIHREPAQQVAEPTHRRLPPSLAGDGLPDDFFPAAEAKPVESAPPPELRNAPVRSAQASRQDFNGAPAPSIPNRIQRIDTAAIRAKQERERVMEARRKSGLVMTADDISNTYERVEWTNRDKDFGENQSKVTATYPVDLTRTITADRFIPAVIIPEISSELEGMVVAQIEQHVYGAHGRKILIPAGSKAIGRYAPLKKVGDTRIRIIWERIITPEGINIRTVNAELADAMGRAGITGEVDNRIWDKYGMAFLISMVSALGQLQVPVDSVNQKAAVDAFGRELSRVSADVLQQGLDIKPRVNIPAGSRVLISPVDDIWFKPPVKNVVQAQFVDEEIKE